MKNFFLLLSSIFFFINVSYTQVNVYTSGFNANVLIDYEFIFGAGNVNLTAGNINNDVITGFDVVIVNQIDQNYNAGVIPKLVDFVNNGGHVILSTEGCTAGGNQLMRTVWNDVTGQNITETASWAAGTPTPPRYHNSIGPWHSSPDVQLTGSTTSYASFGNMYPLNVTHQRLLSPPTCDNIEALSAVYPSHPNLGDGTLYIQGEVQYPFMNFFGSAQVQTHARAIVRMHFALLNNDQALLNTLNTWDPNMAVDTDFLAVQDTAFCGANFTPFSVTAPAIYDSYSWEDPQGNVLGTGQTFNVTQSGVYIIHTTGIPPVCNGIDTLTVEVDSIEFSSTTIASCSNAQEGQVFVNNISANFLAFPITYTLDNTVQLGDSLFTGLSPGSYTLIAEDDRGCIDSMTVIIDGLEVPIPDFTFDTVCVGDITSFTDLSTISNGTITDWEWLIDNTIDNNQNITYQLNASTPVQLKVTSDNGCTDSISQTPFVNPLPEAIISGDASVCLGAPEPQITFTGSGSSSPYTFTYTIDGGPEQTITSTGDIATINAPTNNVGTFTYELVSVEDAGLTACSQLQSGAVTVTVNPLPEATISGDIELCQDAPEPQITFTGSNATAPYTFTYTINGGAQQTVTSTGDIATVNVPTNTPGTFSYELVNVQDASASACDQNQTGTATVVVNPLPEASITGDIELCQDAPEPQITFTGSNSTAPYTFTYTVNGGAQQTITSVGNTATIEVPTNTVGTFNYELISVEDASATACEQNQTGTVTVVVNPLPNASFNGQDLIGCSPICPEIISTSTVGGGATIVNYTWEFSNGETHSSPSATYTECLANYSGNPIYIGVTLTVTTDQGCVSSHNEPNFIQINHNPIADFSFTPENPDVLNNTVDFFNSSSYGDFYSWNFGGIGNSTETNPSFTFPDEGDQEYFVELITSTNEGCTDTVFSIINVVDRIVFYVPNTFTPDGDNYNETFKPVFTSGFDPMDYNLLLFNRWGEVLFESNNAEVGWDGTYGGRIVKDGTYVWKIEFKETMSDKRHTHTGHVNLLR